MMKAWLVEGWSYKTVRKVEVLKRTEKTVTIEAQYCKGGQKIVNPDIFDTFEEAKTFIMEDQTKNVESIRLQLEREKGRLGQMRGMKEPEDK